MLFQFNYQFLFSKQFPKLKKSVLKNECQKLESPKSEGPVDHVAFVIHGIGQQTEQFGFFQKHLNSLFNTTMEVVKLNRPFRPVNIQYIPIEWHKHIHEETDQSMNNITPSSIPMVRMINNDYLSDAFFYLSKERGQSIINHVTKSFNQAYSQFMKENPSFSGKIAILAYSLGGIITWDILSNQTKIKKQHTKIDFQFPTLNFKPDFLFTLGSPLSAFLTVRNQDPTYYRPDSSIIFENIFHPFDPLGYRFEPMLNVKYKQVPAVLVADHVPQGDRLFTSLRHYFLGEPATDEEKLMLSGKRRSTDLDSDPIKRRKSNDVVNSTITRTATTVIDAIDSRSRIDFVLKPEPLLFGLTKNPYLSSLTAHFSYWNHKDLLWHIVRRLENI